MDGLRTLIEQLLATRPGEEFRLGYDGSGEWTADLVNPSAHVPLGEVWGLYQGAGKTPEDAVRDCLTKADAGA